MLPSDTWRAPRLRVVVGGVPLANATDATIISSGGFAADFFRVRAAVSADAATWDWPVPISVNVQIALGPMGSFVSVVQGQADAIGFDPIAGTLTIEGRNNAAALIEARTQETFANRTSSEIATILAGRHGLIADVQATTTPVGRYWELEHDRLTLDAGSRATTEWDLLVTLAGWEGFDLWVTGSTLHFRPTPVLPMPPTLSAAPTAFGPPDFIRLRLDRAMSFAGDIVVTVKSWHSRMGSGTVQVAQTERDAGVSQGYVLVAPNLTPDAAQQMAQRRLAELLSHELCLRAEMPGELTLMPRMTFQLAGTGTSFDRIWEIDEVERRLSMRDGFTQLLRARASSG